MNHNMDAHFQDYDDPLEILEEEILSKDQFPNIRGPFNEDEFMASEILNEANYTTSAYISTQFGNSPHNDPYPTDYTRSTNLAQLTQRSIVPIFSKCYNGENGSNSL
jgi:hypothetical protein